MKKPAGALFYARYKDLMYLLPAEQVKELMVAFCEYAFDDKNPDVSQELIPVWALVKSGIDEDYKQYNDRCEQNKENIKKRWANKTENPPAPVEEVQAEVIKWFNGIIEKIDVMYDYVIYAIGILFYIFKHSLKLWAIGGFSGCATVDKFLAHHCAHR